MKNFKEVKFLETTDYDLFHKLPFNRDVDNAHVKELVESIKKYGFKGVIQVIETSFIDGIEKFYKLDGQHRVAAARIAGVPVTFELTVCKTKRETVEMISALNNSSKAWGTKTFLNVWGSLGLEEYVMMKEIQGLTQIQITPLVMALTGSTRMVEFRKGTMSIPNEKEAKKVIKQLLELNEFLPTKAYCRRGIISVMRMEGYNHSKMMKDVRSYAKNLDFPESELPLKDILIRFLDIKGNKVKKAA
jgi:hypothetical protein